MDGAALLKKIDAVIDALLDLKAELAAPGATSDLSELVADDFSPEHLLDTTSASSRFGYPQDSLRKWCREEGLGVRQGGRWLVSVPRLRARINGG